MVGGAHLIPECSGDNTAGALWRHYCDVRRRLWGVAPPPEPEPEPEPEPPEPAPEPEPPPAPPPEPDGEPPAPDLADMPEPCDSRRERILRATCAAYGVDKRALMTASRKPYIVRRRWVAIALLRRFTVLSLPQIGRVFGFDHTTVLHAVTQMAPVVARIAATLPAEAEIEQWALALRAAMRSRRASKGGRGPKPGPAN